MKVKVFEGGYLPRRAHFDDAGIDFRTPEEFTLVAFDSHVVDLKVAVQIPIGYCGLMFPKSGLNVKADVITHTGVIDSGFRGTIKVRMQNTGGEPYHFEKGDKVTQMVIVPCGLFDIEQVDELDPSESGRDGNGWGSSGK